eukprot:TRINITY_DN1780_c0_g2_i5.p1 TRINITY_DN1780_c0_g2~~TRINITY_DN1780_c0_g2_i5.p1  ORF type:complete len:103 (-),score=8.15 TRINITY_DN1780_c0_g2_i5:243-551(-)
MCIRDSLNLNCRINILSFNPLCGQRTARDGRPTSESLEHGFLDLASLVVHFDLEFHHIATCWSSHQPSADIFVLWPAVSGRDTSSSARLTFLSMEPTLRGFS